MSDIKSELLKKKAQLDEIKKRRKEKELQKKLENDLIQLKSSSSSSSLVASFSSVSASATSDSTSTLSNFQMSNNELINTNNNQHTLLKQFDNLSVEEILEKVGVVSNNNELTKINSNRNLITPSSSSLSLISYSSSTNSIYNNNNNNNTSNNFNNISKSKSKSNTQLTDQESINKKIEKLKLKPDTGLNKVDIFPIERIKYTKETQTLCSVFDENNFSDSYSTHNYSDHEDDHHDLNLNNKSGNKNNSTQTNEGKKSQPKPLAIYDDVLVYDTFTWEDEFTPINDSITDDSKHNSSNKLLLNNKKFNYLLNELNQDSDNYDDDDLTEEIDHNLKSNTDSNDDKQVNSEVDYDDFLRFLVQKRPVVERALKQNEKNIFFDYSASKEDEKIKDEEDTITIQLKKSFYLPDKATSSVITCLDWSVHYPEFLLCSYDNMSFNYEESDSESIIALWNARSDQKLPQQTFTSTSLITSCAFSYYHPNLLVAGTYSGQIVMWDIRSNKRTPVQRSSLSISSHVNPVYCIKVLESQSLVSISNDGKLCTWSLENLNTPVDSQDLILKHATNRQVYATCLDFQTVCSSSIEEKEEPLQDSASNAQATNQSTGQQKHAIIGAEDGLSHSLTVNNKFSLNQTFEGHFGPVTGVSCFTQCTPDINDQPYWINNSLSQFFLTSSFDSTVKLWNMTDNTDPIYTFESHGEYVYDVGWSPIHPALFASVDGSGRLDFWHLNKDTEAPTASIDVDNRTRALNKLKWSRKGTEIAVGDDHGEMRIYEISENFAWPNHDDFENLVKTLDNLKKLSQESIHFNLNSNSDSNYINYLIESFR